MLSRTNFLVRRRAIFSVRPAEVGAARRSDQDWPKATAVRRPGLDRFEHSAIVSPTGLGRH